MFDTLTYANKLKEAGFTERQTETIATTQAELIDKQLVTREYLDLRLAEVKRDIKELELRQETRFKEIGGKFFLINRMLGFVLAGILSLIVKAFFTH